MSHDTIIFTSNGRSDPDAVVGYDRILRTLFLQAFPDESGDDLALWLVIGDREYATLDAPHKAARLRGFDFMPLCDDIALQLVAQQTLHADRPRMTARLWPLLQHLQPKWPQATRRGPRRTTSGAGLLSVRSDR